MVAYILATLNFNIPENDTINQKRVSDITF